MALNDTLRIMTVSAIGLLAPAALCQAQANVKRVTVPVSIEGQSSPAACEAAARAEAARIATAQVVGQACGAGGSAPGVAEDPEGFVRRMRVGDVQATASGCTAKVRVEVEAWAIEDECEAGRTGGGRPIGVLMQYIRYGEIVPSTEAGSYEPVIAFEKQLAENGFEIIPLIELFDDFQDQARSVKEAVVDDEFVFKKMRQGLTDTILDALDRIDRAVQAQPNRFWPGLEKFRRLYDGNVLVVGQIHIDKSEDGRVLTVRPSVQLLNIQDRTSWGANFQEQVAARIHRDAVSLEPALISDLADNFASHAAEILPKP